MKSREFARDNRRNDLLCQNAKCISHCVSGTYTKFGECGLVLDTFNVRIVHDAESFVSLGVPDGVGTGADPAHRPVVLCPEPSAFAGLEADGMPEIMSIEISNLTFAYQGAKPVLCDISIQIEGAGFVVLTGPSGCGKTTLLKLLLSTPSILSSGKVNGTVKINGQDPLAAVADGHISYMSQEDSLFPNLTLLDNLRLPFLIKGETIPPGFKELIELAGLHNYLSHFPYQLSGGTKKRGELVRAFLTHPSLVLLDEPFSKQDICHKNSLYEYLLRFQSMTSALVILVTHDLLEAVLLSNRILVMNTSGNIAKDMRIAKSLPRILAPDGITVVEDEFVELRSLILNKPTS